MITEAERRFALKQLDQSRIRLLGILEGLSSAQLSYRPEPGCWSIAENVEHVVIVEKRLIGATEKVLQESPDVSDRCLKSDAEVVWLVGTVVDKLRAPDRVLPTLRWPVETLADEFETVRNHTRDFTSKTDGDLRHHFLPHPYFGDFDCYQWLLAAGAHCNRHSAQSEIIKISQRFPRP